MYNRGHDDHHSASRLVRGLIPAGSKLGQCVQLQAVGWCLQVPLLDALIIVRHGDAAVGR